MFSYLNKQFNFDDPDVVSSIDELPLWSSYFGAVLLDKVKFKPSINILDIGCGNGFPMLEIAQRFGASCTVYGIDPWKKAVERAKLKAGTFGISNINIIEGNAEELPFDDDFFSLAVSNNGTNNVQDACAVFREINRVCKKNAQFVFTVNMPSTMIEFYNLFEEALLEHGLAAGVEKMKLHINEKRKTMQQNLELINSSGFRINEISEHSFFIRFINGTAMFNHSFIQLAFLDSWKKLVPDELRNEVFACVEKKMNLSAEKNGEFSLTIPFSCFNCSKI